MIKNRVMFIVINLNICCINLLNRLIICRLELVLKRNDPVVYLGLVVCGTWSHKILWVMLDENYSDDRAPRLTQRNHKSSFHGLRLELPSYFIVDHAYESHKLLLVCEYIEMQVFSNLKKLGVGSIKGECAYTYLQRINNIVWCTSNISEGTAKRHQFLKLMQRPHLREYGVAKVLRFLGCLGDQSRRLKTCLNTCSRMVCHDVD